MQDKGFNLKEFGVYSSFPFIAMLIGEVVGAFLSDKLVPRNSSIQRFITRGHLHVCDGHYD